MDGQKHRLPGRNRIAWLLLGLVSLSVPNPNAVLAAECSPDICVGNPCTITGHHELEPNCSLDFSNQDVMIADDAVLQVTGDGATQIAAQNLTLRGAIQADTTAGSEIVVNVAGKFTTPAGARGEFKAGDNDSRAGGPIRLTAGGEVDLQGSAEFSNTPGGQFFIVGRQVTVNQAIVTQGPGRVDIRASAGPIAIHKPIDVSGTGQRQGGSIFLLATGDVTVAAPLLLKAPATSSSNGVVLEGRNVYVKSSTTSPMIDLSSGDGSASGGGKIVAHSDDASGESGLVVLDGRISLDSGNNGSAGELAVSAEAKLDISGKISAKASGPSGSGGTLLLLGKPESTIRLSGSFIATGEGRGGEIEIGAVEGKAVKAIVFAGDVTLNTQSAGTEGVNRLRYRRVFRAMGNGIVKLLSTPNSTARGNIIECECLDNNPADGTCDEDACIRSPSGFKSALTLPALQLRPTVFEP